ncbi:MAG: polysaccharide biosynthesis C-terminal domain-containing protein [Clostridia bacterium]|nr:polysaccharide biosynthesis C-terminal domain-containing protein [Clostridia bacterium]
MRIGKNSIAYGAGVLALSGISLQVISFAYRVVLARLAGEEGMALYQLSMQVYLMLSALCIGGITLTVSNFTARARARGEDGGQVVGFGIRLFLCLLILGGGTVILLGRPISQRLLGDGRVYGAALLMVPCIALTGVENILKAYFHGVRNLKAPIVSENTEIVARALAVCSLLVVVAPSRPGERAMLIVLGMILAEVISVTFLSTCFMRRKRGAPCRDRFGTFAASALPVSASGLLTRALASANTVLMPRAFMAAGLTQQAAMSTFGALTGMTIPMLFLPGCVLMPVLSVVTPKLSEDKQAQNEGDIRRKTGKVIHLTSLVMIPSMTLLALFGRPLSQALYRSPLAGDWIALLCPAILMAFYHSATGGILNGIGREKRASVSVCTEGGLLLAGTLILGGKLKWGVAGYVVSELISNAVGMILNMVWTVRYTGVRMQWFNWFGRPILASLAGAGAAWLTVWVARVPEESFWLPLTVGALGFSVALRLLGTDAPAYLRKLIK